MDGGEMTHSEASELIGTQANWLLSDVTVTVRILDARWAYGRVDLLVTPSNGDGETWVSADRVDTQTSTL